MVVELITIGTELLAGHTLNTNARYVGDQLARIGLILARQISIPDDHEVIVTTIRESLERADWVLVSGGLGPTHDDMTKKALARVFGKTLVFHDELLAQLKERYNRSGRPVSPLLDTQAVQPADAELIPNDVGTAVGILLTEGSKTLVAVPGVPREMRPMIAEHIVPRIAQQLRRPCAGRTWSTTGWPESRLYEALQPVMQAHPDVSVAFLPSELGVRIRFTTDVADAEAALERFADSARPVIGQAVFAETDTEIETVIGQLLRQKGRTVAFAESCTGGLIAKRMTDVPGASAYVLHSVVAYANAAKTSFLGVDPALIDHHGAVSEPVAIAMAEGARSKGNADYAISVTGIAGPTGGTAEKPVGLVWIGLATAHHGTTARKVHLRGNRTLIRARAAQAALNLLRQELLGYDSGTQT